MSPDEPMAVLQGALFPVAHDSAAPAVSAPAPVVPDVPRFDVILAQLAREHPDWTAEAIREAGIAQRRVARGLPAGPRISETHPGRPT